MKAMITTVALTLGLLTTAHATTLLKGPPRNFGEHRIHSMDLAMEMHKALSSENLRKAVLESFEVALSKGDSKSTGFDPLQMTEALKIKVQTVDGTRYSVGQIAFLTKEMTSPARLQVLKKEAKTPAEKELADLLNEYQAEVIQFIANSAKMLDRSENTNSLAAKAARRQLSLLPDILMLYGRDGNVKHLKGHLEVMKETNAMLKDNRQMSFETAYELVVAKRNGLLTADGKISNQEALNKILEDIFGCSRA